MAIRKVRIETVFWHLRDHTAKLGDQVSVGDLIAHSDNTGYSLGPHLHFQCNQTDEHGKSGQAFDPMPYFVWDTDMLRMVKTETSEDIYLVDSAGLRSKIFNVGLFQKIGGNIELVDILTEEELDTIPDSGVELAEIKKL